MAERVLERAQAGQGAFDVALWRALCAQGVLELARPGERALRMLVAGLEVLGQHALPGPLADTLLGLALVSDAEAEPLLSGTGLCVVAAPPRVPHAAQATLLLELANDGVFRLAARGDATLSDGLGAEAWGELSLTRAARFEDAPRALLLHDVALAAQLAALALGLVKRTAEHAATRKQFGKPLSAFQAVSHPLASAYIALSAAGLLARAAACAFDDAEVARARTLASAALVSARRAALEAVYTCHQKLGALGITLEGPAHHVGRRVRTLATRCAARIDATRESLLFPAGDAP
jgi:hypothetical protein